MEQGRQTITETEKDNLKSDSTKERQAILLHKQQRESKQAEKEHLKSEGHQGNEGEK